MPTPIGSSRDHEKEFLRALKGKQIALTMLNGEGMTAILKDIFDECLLMDEHGKSILVYRRAIATLQQAGG